MCGFPTRGAASQRAGAAATSAAAAAAANRTAANGTRGLSQPDLGAAGTNSVNATGQQHNPAANATNSSSAAQLSVNGRAQAGRNASSPALPLAPLADTGGPSCRMLAEVDLQTGVVEYGCG